jgi:predicted acetyltransferase
MWWIVERDAVLGGIALGTQTNDTVARIGHVGYGVRPSSRGRGVATWALGELLPHARAAALDRVLLVCLDDNVGSIKTIERHGGVLEAVVDDDHGLVRRYWIDL